MVAVEPIRKKTDIKKIEKYFEKHNLRDYLLFKMGINLGLRISDLLKLNVIDVKGKSNIKLNEQKTGKFRIVPVNKNIQILIDKFIQNRPDNEPLFKTRFNNRLERTMVYRIMNKTCEKLSVNAIIGTHTLRKTFGYHFYKEFNDINLLQKIFNHSSSLITLRYIGIDQDKITQAYLKFEL